MNGGPSQVDTFDPKPALAKHHEAEYRGGTPVGSNGRPVGRLMKSPFTFRKRGQSGLEVSDLFPNTAQFADDLCVVRSLYTDTAAHASGCLQMNTGSVLLGRPCLGTWLGYGLGTASEDLPGFVVMTDPRGGPIGGASNWSPGSCPPPTRGRSSEARGRRSWTWPRPPASDPTPSAATSTCSAAQTGARGLAPGRNGTGGPGPVLRAGLPDADERRRGRRPRPRRRLDPRPLRPRRRPHPRLRPQVPA